jgi:hypothetical protein
MNCVDCTYEGRRRTDGNIARLCLILLLICCVVGLLLSTVFIYLHIDSRLSRLEDKLSSSPSTVLPTTNVEVRRSLRDENNVQNEEKNQGKVRELGNVDLDSKVER